MPALFGKCKGLLIRIYKQAPVEGGLKKEQGLE